MILALGAARAAAADPYVPGRAAFGLRWGEEEDDLRIMTATVAPAGVLTLAVTEAAVEDRPAPVAQYALEAPAGLALPAGPGRWTWRAPEAPGLYPLRVVRSPGGEAVTLNVFVVVPLSRVEGGWLNGYRIGEYPVTALRGQTAYDPPDGLIEVTEELAATRVSPHFTLGQFLCKQDGGWPRYIVLRPRLVSKLEHLLDQVNALGHRCDTFAVMSGYRTPWYNHAIGNVKYSRHIYGGAADIFIDHAPRDGQMDDLNRDGRVDVRDAAILYAIIDDRYGDPEYSPYVGGLGQYRRTPSHGPFVHVDVRGTRARWGD